MQNRLQRTIETIRAVTDATDNLLLRNELINDPDLIFVLDKNHPHNVIHFRFAPFLTKDGEEKSPYDESTIYVTIDATKENEGRLYSWNFIHGNSDDLTLYCEDIQNANGGHVSFADACRDEPELEEDRPVLQEYHKIIAEIMKKLDPALYINYTEEEQFFTKTTMEKYIKSKQRVRLL